MSATAWPDERPTVPAPHVASKTLAFASRADRLVELALDRIRSGEDRDAIAAPLVQLQALIAGVR